MADTAARRFKSFGQAGGLDVAWFFKQNRREYKRFVETQTFQRLEGPGGA